MIKLVLTDLDNTIVPFGAEEVSDRGMHAIHALADQGIRFGPASGRALGSLRRFFRFDDVCTQTAVASNGLEVYADGQLVAAWEFDRDILEKTVEALRDVPSAALVVENPDDEATPPGLVGLGSVPCALMDNSLVFPYGYEVSDAIPDDWRLTKVSFCYDAAYVTREEMEAILAAVYPDLDPRKSINDWFDVAPKGWSKANGVRALAASLGISLDDVVVFGDNLNDLEMLQLVPHSVAVSNAVPEAAAAARYHIGASSDDAVAKAMEEIAAATAEGSMPRFMR